MFPVVLVTLNDAVAVLVVLMLVPEPNVTFPDSLAIPPLPGLRQAGGDLTVLANSG